MKKSIITEFISGTPSSTYSVTTGYSVGSEWVNTDNGNRFYHKTDTNWVPLNVDPIFYIQGGTSSAVDTASNIYRTGSLNIGTGTATDGRFVVSSSTGSVSLIVGENGSVSIGGVLTSFPLKVYGSAQVTSFFYTNITEVSTAIIFDGAGNTGIKRNNLGLEFFNFATSSSSTIRFTNNSYGTNTGETTMLVDVDKKYVGIGTASPSTKLHIFATQSGAFRLEDGTQANGYVLTSDANGVGSWTSSVPLLTDYNFKNIDSSLVSGTYSVIETDYTKTLVYTGTSSISVVLSTGTTYSVGRWMNVLQKGAGQITIGANGFILSYSSDELPTTFGANSLATVFVYSASTPELIVSGKLKLV